MKANCCSGVLRCIAFATSLKLSVPVVPYKKEIPNNINPEEKAEDMMSFKAASEERFKCKSKFAKAANGIVDSSNDR